MNYLSITKRTAVIFAVASTCFFGATVTSFAEWDTGSVGTYTSSWDTGSVGSASTGWDSGSVGTTVGPASTGWDSGSVGTYTNGWDSGSVGTTVGPASTGWDSGSVGTYTNGWDTGSVGTYTNGWDTGSVGTYPGYSGTWDTGTVATVPGNSGTWDTGVTSSGYTYTPGYAYTPAQTYSPSTGVISMTGGVYQVSNPVVTTGTVISGTTYCSNGTLPVNGQCNTVTTIPTTTRTVCSDGYAPTNGSCVRTNTLPTTINTICSDGSAPVNGSCVRNNTLPTTVNTICSDGGAPINGTCVRNNTIPTTVNTLCSDGYAPTNGSCVRVTNVPTTYYQSCWDGSRIPTSAVCPAQYKTCPNGTTVPVTQACAVVTTPVYLPPQVVKFNNVVTSVATEISKTSGRCNGIGLVANNAPSTGWFEYGETSALGRTTATANIGSANTAPFSNVLANLKPSTRYYCRAVMQNQYGLVKGEIVSFVTKSTVVTYVKPVVTKPVVTKTPVKTNVITCSDGSTVPTKSTTSATLINQGEKLVAVQIEKIDGTLSSGEVIRYKVTYRNLADTRLSGVLVKITLPQEIIFAGSSAGNYDVTTRTLTLNQDSIDPYTEGVIIITANVQKDAPIGKTIVANVYAMYTVPGTHTQDEVTAYVIGSITPAQVISNQDTGAKKVIGASGERGFMPNTLIEWLALLAILFIIFILGRSVYASYKEDDHAHKH